MNDRDREELTAGQLHNRANLFTKYQEEMNKCLEYLNYVSLNWIDKREYRRKWLKPPEKPSILTLESLRDEIYLQRMAKVIKLDSVQVDAKQNTE